MNILPSIDILGVNVSNAKTTDVLEYLFTNIQKTGQKTAIFTPNPEILVYASKHNNYKDVLNQALVNLPDGQGIIMAGKILGKPFKQRLTGTDFMEIVCKECVRKGVSIGLLGSGPGVAEKAAKCLQSKYPGINIIFAASELAEIENIINKHESGIRNKDEVRSNKESFIIPNSSFPIPAVDILFVAFGHPKQEEWISKNLEELPVKSAMGVGGAFDYISGKVPRAPVFVRRMGLEWLYRLSRQPWRWRRQLALIEFCWLIIKEKIADKQNTAEI